jgi:predicted metal-dependent hydrolase
LKDLGEFSPEDREGILKGVHEFNKGFYFECHDTLEEVWAGVRGEGRDFLQGLIQVSVAFYHLTGGNLVGAESLFLRALQRFSRYPARAYGFDLDAQREEIKARLARIRSGEAGVEPSPTWVFGGEGEGVS